MMADTSLMSENSVVNMNGVCPTSTAKDNERKSILPNQLPPKYPRVYRLKLESFLTEDLYSFFADEMLPKIRTRSVGKAIVAYVNRTIKPSGWSAVWRSSKKSSKLSFSCDFVVKVLALSDEKLEADVLFRSLLTDLDIFTDPEEKKAEVDKLMSSSITQVPLIELYTICEGDDEEEFLKTAIIIEHIRFFYRYIWRPWDEDGDNVIFVDSFLKSRLDFFKEFNSKSLSLKAMTRAKYLLETGWMIRERLEQLQSKIPLTDAEIELNSSELSEIMKLQLQMESLEREMAILESPVARALLVDNYQDWGEQSRKRSEDVSFTHVVAHSFSMQKLKELPIEPDGDLEFHHNLSDAINKCCSGDTILILPGVYPTQGITLSEKDFILKGLGSAPSVILEGQGNGDVMISCISPKIHLQNLTFRSDCFMQSLFVIGNGNVDVQECIIEGENSLVGLTALKGSHVNLTDCSFTKCRCDGIKMSPGSSVSLTGCKIVASGDSGITIDAKEDMSKEGQKITLHTDNVLIQECGGSALSIEIGSKEKYEHVGGDFEDVTKAVLSFPWLEINFDGITSKANETGNMSIISRTSSQSSLDSAPDDEKRLEYAYLRSFLVESFSDESSGEDGFENEEEVLERQDASSSEVASDQEEKDAAKQQVTLEGAGEEKEMSQREGDDTLKQEEEGGEGKTLKIEEGGEIMEMLRGAEGGEKDETLKREGDIENKKEAFKTLEGHEKEETLKREQGDEKDATLKVEVVAGTKQDADK